MENLFSPLSAENAAIADENGRREMGSSENSESSSVNKSVAGFCGVNSSNTQLMSPSLYPVCNLYPLCVCRQNPEAQRPWIGPQLTVDQRDQRAVEAYKTKVARNNRRIARQKSLSKNTAPIPATPSSCPSFNRIDSKKKSGLDGAGNSQGSKNSELYTFVTPDNKKLRLLLKKELKNSDVGNLGRIVLPKKEAEENLPFLSEKDGIVVVIRDVYSDQKWSLKFKYWSNNKSRMYVLESTGDFVKQNGMEAGDSLSLYEDENLNLYFTVKKVEREDAKSYRAVTEEEASLALLIEQLQHKDHRLVTLSMDNTGNGSAEGSSSNDMMIDDCYTGLDLLPDVHSYNFSL